MTTNETIKELWARETELVTELNSRPCPIERASSVEDGLERIARREQAERELEAVRAYRRTLTEQQRAAERREHEITEWRERATRYEQQLPDAIDADKRDGSRRPHPSREAVLRDNIALAQRQLAKLEAEAEGARA